ncbi:MAG: hypothetical protein JO199_05465 [Candidatus Eremiobacteraeota bacterium]|nr:hypothetical protein [Candidatus Eremiobacteraeota bacterium]
MKPPRALLLGLHACVALTVWCIAAGCNSSSNGAPLPTSPPATPVPTPTPAYHVIYRFQGGNDGAVPTGGMTVAGGVLYGTTESGGAGGDGTAFSLAPGAATDTVLHAFTGSPADGKAPFAAPIALDGVLYGTTAYGGANGRGTIFRIDEDGANYRLLYQFGAKTSTDGQVPFAGLTAVGSTLYGITSGGGTHHQAGTTFEIDPNGSNYAVLHNFGAGTDGVEPLASLTLSGGALYGTTAYGGKYPCRLYSYCGTLFRMDANGGERVLYDFGRAKDGYGPQASLTDDNGRLYGTTYLGGSYGLCPNGHGVDRTCGTVFGIDADGRGYSVLREFGSRGGSEPLGNVIVVNGLLYGTTYFGGDFNAGTVFNVHTDGSRYHVVHSFGASATDGKFPQGNLAYSNGVLYGTTTQGGSGNSGTVFSITP